VLSHETTACTIALIDCNPEALQQFKKQLCSIPSSVIVEIPIKTLDKAGVKEKILSSYDLILTTSTHYPALLENYPALSGKLIPFATALSTAAIMKIARLSLTAQIGVICNSRRFFSIVLSQIQPAHIPQKNVHSFFINSEQTFSENTFSENSLPFPELCTKCDVLITAPGITCMDDPFFLPHVMQFTGRGGVIIPFEYRIEKGSLIHIEERVRQFFENTGHQQIYYSG